MSSFEEVFEAFKHKLASFADDGYRFSGDYTLYRQSQQEAFQGYRAGIEAGKPHGYIELPTGVGKTALFIALIKNYLDAANGSENAPRVLIAVPTQKLAVQTAQAFAKFMPEIAKTIETDDDESQEIDWENSEVGLQYGKLKHAHKKPKVLITTYQSLTKDTSNKTYPPEEYGLVIYDEGHVITAPIFGRVVDKFHASAQLAVTATSEYSETKTVASRLAHRYFQLPLAEAINRGDLCNVRPAILKTGYTIDESKFTELMERQGGTPLSEAQLELLLNQEARNKAVIETYLRGADPDSGIRYLGQNGMIFCTAVRHADTITDQFRKTLEEGEGIQIREWLDGEEIELIAAVHGKTEGAYLRKGMLLGKPPEERQYLEDKEWYSEEEIFYLHGCGKILLLASVAKLKWGYDSPRDSVLFDLADRFSKVDATQIDGRALRLDPEDTDKTATVFNLMDENTEELYRKYPKLIPIYCAEVIEGAQFRPPAKRIKAHVRFKEHPPQMAKSLEEAGFSVITDIDAVRTISRNNKSARTKALTPAPEKTDEWLGIVDMGRRTRTDPLKISTSYKALQGAWNQAKEKNEKTFSADGYTIPVEQAGVFKSGSVTSFCLHEDTVPLFTVPEKTPQWLNIKEMGQRTRTNQKKISTIYKISQEAWKQAKEREEKTFSAEGHAIPVEQAGIFKFSFGTVFCLHEDTLPLFTVPEKTPQWLSIEDMGRRTRTNQRKISTIYKISQEAWKQAKEREEKTFSAEGHAIPVEQAGIFKSGSVTVFCLHEDTVPLLGVPQKTLQWLGIMDMSRRIHAIPMKISPLYKALEEAWNQAKEKNEKTFSAEGYTIPVEQAGIFKSGSMTVFCLHEDAVPLISVPEKTADWLNAEDMCKKLRNDIRGIRALYKVLQPAWKKATSKGRAEFTAASLKIPTNKAGTFRNVSSYTFCIHTDMAPLLEERIKGMPQPEL